MDPEERRLQLLAAARAVFARQGYHGTSVADVIAEARVARGTFYNYFDSKRAIFQEVLVGLAQEITAAARPIDVNRPLAPQVRDNFSVVISAAMAPEAARLLFGEAVGMDAEGDAALRAFYDAAVARLRASLELGQRIGVVRQGDMGLTAECIIGMIKGPVLIAALRGEQLDPDALVDEVYLLLSVGALTVDLG